MARLGSGKTKGGTFPGQFDPKQGTFNAELVGLQLYHSDNFQDKNKLELCLGFMLDIDDPDAENEPQENGLYRHVESFVRLQVDEEGNFGPGGAKAKAYKLISAFYGADFNSFGDEFEWWFDFPRGVEFMSIDDIPHHKSYKQGEEWLRLEDIFIKADANTPERGIIGNKAMVKIGYAQKPDKSFSDKLSIVEAIALPRSGGAKRRPAAAARTAPAPAAATPPTPAPAAPATPVATGDAKLPRYITFVLEKSAELGIPAEHFQGWFGYFTDQEIAEPTSFSKEQAKLFKTAYDNDSDQITRSYSEWAEFILPVAEAQTANDGEFPEDPDDDFWGEEEKATTA